MKKNIYLIILLIFLMLPAQAIEDIKIKEGEKLSLSDCVAIAINNSPMIKHYEYEMLIAKSNVGIAKSVYFPTLFSNVGIYQDYNSNKHYNGSSNRDMPSVGLTINQLIWNFGKSSSLIKMEQFYKLAAEYRFMDSICNTIYDVKLHYFEVLKAKAFLEIERNNLLINEKIYSRTKKLYANKEISKVDYINAQMFLTEAEMKVLDAENAYDLAMADLGNSLYLAYAPSFEIKDASTFSFSDIYVPHSLTAESGVVNIAFKTKIEKNDNTKPKNLPFTMEQAFKLANDNSPDLWVLDATLGAMQQSVQFIKKQYYPDLYGNVGYGYNNTRDHNNNSLNMSVGLSSALNIKQLKYEIEAAQGQVNLAINDINEFKQDLYFEVKKCYLNTTKSSKQLPIAQKKVHQALENFELEDSRYNTEKSDYVALHASRENYNEAKQSYVTHIYDYNVSLANLEIAMHYHLDDIHQQAEHAMHYHYKDIINKLDSVLYCDHKNEEELKDKSPHKHDH